MNPSSEDKELEDFLSGRSDLSRRYKAMSAEEPPAQLDRAVLEKARAAVEEGASKVAPFRRPSRWMVPFAVAATVLLSYAIFREVDVGTVATRESPVPVMAPMPAGQPLQENHQAADAVESEERPVAPAAQAERDLQKSSRQAMPSKRRLEVREKTEAIGGLSSTTTPMNAPAPAAPSLADTAQVAQEQSAPPGSASSGAAVLDSLSSAKAYAPRSAISRQREEAKSTAELRTPEAWLEDVRKLRVEGKQTQADAELKRFLEAYPDYFEKNPHIERP